MPGLLPVFRKLAEHLEMVILSGSLPGKDPEIGENNTGSMGERQFERLNSLSSVSRDNQLFLFLILRGDKSWAET